MTDLTSINDEDTKERISSWLKGPFDEKTKNEILLLLKNNPTELTNSFYKNLSFGTGGIREIMGVGTNRLNIYTIRFVTQGLANYLISQNKINIVVIGYDTRNNSLLFAQECAKVLAANNIKVFLFKNPRPTPLISFACRYKKASAAIMITASHNSAEYNGYKVYWNDGGQVLPPHDVGIIKEVEKITSLAQVKVSSLDDDLILFLSEEIDNAYLFELSSLNYFEKKTEEMGKVISIIYSNLHGTGITILPNALEKWGFTNLAIVKKQESMNGNFPFAPNPNPEEKEALFLGTELLVETNGDIFIATDPDADRVAVVVNHRGNPVILSGNQIAVILLYFICSTNTSLPKNGACIKSIVTTNLFDKIAKHFHLTPIHVLTGFKYISEKIRQWEVSNEYTYIFGAEESYGYLAQTFVRDKDSISASCLIAQATMLAKKHNNTLYDYLLEIYKRFGIFREYLHSIKFENGKNGMDKMNNIMLKLRTNFFTKIGDFTVSFVDDYLNSTHNNIINNTSFAINLPKSNVLAFHLSDNSSIIIRPSGTEPKIKIYIGSQYQITNESVEEGIVLCEKKIQLLLQSFLKSIS